MITYRDAVRCARANMTRAANYLEAAKDEPERSDHWMGLAYRANARADMWLLEAERLKPGDGETVQ